MAERRFIDVFREYAEEANLAAKRELGTRKRGRNKTYGATRAATLRDALSVEVQGRGWYVTASFGVSGPPEAYAAFLYYGVRGTQENQGSDTTGVDDPVDPGFAFSSKQPPLKPIQEWLKAKPVRLRGEGGQFKSPAKYKSKRTGKEVDPTRSVAFLISRSIKERGIYGLRWWERMVPKVWEQYRPELDKAMTSDIRIAISASLGGGFKLK